MLKVSVVEDQEDIRKSLVKHIERTEGMICVSHHPSAEEALEQLPLHQPQLVLMDIGLPKMSGVECLIRILLGGAKIDFLMFTVFDEDEHVFGALQAGAVGYVLKGEGAKGAINAIKEYEAGGSPMSRSIARKVLASFHPKPKKSFEELTKQQTIILQQISEGLLNKEIAARLGISERTVKQHNYAIYKKLQVNNRTEAVKRYLEGKV